MKIVVDALHSREGGGRSFLVNSIRAWLDLEEARDDVLILLTSDVPLADAFRTEQRVKTIFARELPVPLRLLAGTFRGQYLLKRFDADILYCPGNFGPLVQFRSKTVITLQNPHYFTTRRYQFSRWIRWRLNVERAISEYTLRRADLVVAISHSLATEACGTIGLKNLRVIPSGGNTRFLEGASVPQREEGEFLAGCPFILCVNNLYEHKATELIVDACALAWPNAGQRLPLVIVGGEVHPMARRRLQRAQDASGYPVVRLTRVDRDLLSQLYEAAALYISASMAEAYPLTPGEAASFGTPTVLSDIAPHREVLPNAAFFEPGNAVAAAEVIRRMVPLPQSGALGMRKSASPRPLGRDGNDWTWCDQAAELRNCMVSLLANDKR